MYREYTQTTSLSLSHSLTLSLSLAHTHTHTLAHTHTHSHTHTHTHTRTHSLTHSLTHTPGARLHVPRVHYDDNTPLRHRLHRQLLALRSRVSLLLALGRTRTQTCPGKVVLKRAVVLFYNVGGRARTEFVGPLDLMQLTAATEYVETKKIHSAVIGLDRDLVQGFVARNLGSL